MQGTKICSFKVFEAFDAVERVGNGCQSEDEDEKGKEEKEEVHEEGFPNGLSPSVAKNFFEIQGEKEEEKPARERIENASALVSKEKGVEEGKCDHLSADEDLDEEVFCQRGAGTGGRFSEDEPREESEEKWSRSSETALWESSHLAALLKAFSELSKVTFPSPVLTIVLSLMASYSFVCSFWKMAVGRSATCESVCSPKLASAKKMQSTKSIFTGGK